MIFAKDSRFPGCPFLMCNMEGKKMDIQQIPEEGAILSQLTADQRQLLEKYALSADKVGGFEEADSNEDAELVNDWLKILTTDGLDFSFPEKILLSRKDIEESKGTKFFAELSENPRFRKKMIFKAEKGSKKVFVNSLKNDTEYFWRMGYTDKKGKIRYSPVSFFRTEEAFPRWIHIEGASNVRDIGGKLTIYGKKIRQGLLYRGCALNKRILVPRKGLDFLTGNLKIKSDLDIRSNDGPAVKHTHKRIAHILLLHKCTVIPHSFINFHCNGTDKSVPCGTAFHLCRRECIDTFHDPTGGR